MSDGIIRRITGSQFTLPKLIQRAVPITLDPAPFNGAIVRGTDNQLYISDGVAWDWVNKESVEALIAETRRQLTESLEVTVGTGGDFATLGAALNFFGSYFPAFTDASDPPIVGRISILSGTTISEQITLDSPSLGWVYIDSEDSVVPVDPAGLGIAVGRISTSTPMQGFHPFIYVRGGVGPSVEARFVLQAGTIPPDMSFNGGDYTLLSFGVWATGIVGVYDGGGFGGFHVGARPAGGGYVDGVGANFDDNLTFGIEATNQARFRGLSTTARRCGTAGIIVSAFSTALLGISGDYRKTNDVSDPTDIQAITGSTINLGSNVISGGYSQVANRLSPSGGTIIDTAQPAANLIAPLSYTVADAPSAASRIREMIYVSNGAAGQPIMAFSDGTNWRRCDTRDVISA
jgi:hypothetical protein